MDLARHGSAGGRTQLKVLTLFLLLAVAFAVSAQQPADQSSAAVEPKAFNKVEITGEGGRSFFVFSVEGFHYIIRADGHAESNSGKPRPQNFDLRLGRNGHVVRVYFTEYEGDLLLIYEVSDKQYGWGFVERLNQKTLKPRWLKPVNGFNIGPGLVEANHAYLSAVDLLAKIDLQSGNSVWQKQGFQEQYVLSTEGFRLPSINGEQVFFREDAEKGKTVEVDKTSGQILSVRN
jgi:hypothetical protein